MLGLAHDNLTEKETLVVRTGATLAPRGCLLLVRRVEELGWPAAEVAEAAGLSRATGCKRLRRFRTEGQPGLAGDRSSGRSDRPEHCPPSRLRGSSSCVVDSSADRIGWPRCRDTRGGPSMPCCGVMGAPGCVTFDRVTGRPLRYVR